MAKRMLDCYASDFAGFSKEELLESVRRSEGRVMLCETIGTVRPMLGDVTNAEFAAAMGADFLLLNMFDVNEPKIEGLPAGQPEDTVRLIKRLTGRPVGINLEPTDTGEDADIDPLWQMSAGRRATLVNARRACDMGVDLILLTGNPGMGVSNEAIEATLKLYREELGDRVILAAGKMHAAGVLTEAAEQIMTKEDVRRFREAGADVLLFPAPGTAVCPFVPELSLSVCTLVNRLNSRPKYVTAQGISELLPAVATSSVTAFGKPSSGNRACGSPDHQLHRENLFHQPFFFLYKI